LSIVIITQPKRPFKRQKVDKKGTIGGQKGDSATVCITDFRPYTKKEPDIAYAIRLFS